MFNRGYVIMFFRFFKVIEVSVTFFLSVQQGWFFD